MTKAVLGANTLNYIDIMPGVKYKDVLNYLDSTVVFGDASVCGWNPNGTDTFTQRTIEVAPIKIKSDDRCVFSLEGCDGLGAILKVQSY